MLLLFRICKLFEAKSLSCKFNKISSDETIKRERRLQNYLRSLKNLDETDNKRISYHVVHVLALCIVYQKYIRPIISEVGTYNYKLAKLLVEILSPLLDNNIHIIKNTLDFCK